MGYLDEELLEAKRKLERQKHTTLEAGIYVGEEEKALDHILFWFDIAQRASNKNPFVGDPKEDIEAMKDGANAWKRDNNIVSE